MNKCKNTRNTRYETTLCYLCEIFEEYIDEIYKIDLDDYLLDKKYSKYTRQYAYENNCMYVSLAQVLPYISWDIARRYNFIPTKKKGEVIRWK